MLIAVLFYFAESGERLKQKHYQAWQVVDTAQGKGGNGGGIDALQELNADGVPLVGVDLSMAVLQGIRLKKVNLSRANLAGADTRNAEMPGKPGESKLAVSEFSGRKDAGGVVAPVRDGGGRLYGSRLAGCGPEGSKTERS